MEMCIKLYSEENFESAKNGINITRKLVSKTKGNCHPMLDAIETTIKVCIENEKLETLIKRLYGLKKEFNRVSVCICFI